jgi:hypothetical protein
MGAVFEPVDPPGDPVAPRLDPAMVFLDGFQKVVGYFLKAAPCSRSWLPLSART